MSTHRTWDEMRSPQWKYLFQKESINRRRTRKEIERERKETREERGTQYGKESKKKRTGKIRKVSKEQLKAKQEATNNEIQRLLKNNAPK